MPLAATITVEVPPNASSIAWAVVVKGDGTGDLTVTATCAGESAQTVDTSNGVTAGLLSGSWPVAAGWAGNAVTFQLAATQTSGVLFDAEFDPSMWETNVVVGASVA